MNPKEIGKPFPTPTQLLQIRFSPDGNTLAGAGMDGSVHRWDVSGKEPKELPALKGHNGWVTQVAYASDRLFSCDSWGELTALDAEGKQSWTHAEAHAGCVRQIRSSPDRKTLATCGADGFVRLWNTADGKKTAELKQHADTLSLAFHPDGKTIVAGDLFGVIRVWKDGKEVRTLDAKQMHLYERIQDVGGVRCLLFDKEGKRLVAAGAQPKTGAFVQAFPLLFVFDFESGKVLHTLKGATDNEGFFHDIAWHPEGGLLAVSSGQPGQGKLWLWNLGEAAPAFTYTKMPNCHSLAVHDTRLAVSGTNANSSGNGRVKGKGGEYPANHSPIQMWSLG